MPKASQVSLSLEFLRLRRCLYIKLPGVDQKSLWSECLGLASNLSHRMSEVSQVSLSLECLGPLTVSVIGMPEVSQKILSLEGLGVARSLSCKNVWDRPGVSPVQMCGVSQEFLSLARSLFHRMQEVGQFPLLRMTEVARLSIIRMSGISQDSPSLECLASTRCLSHWND